MTKIFRMQVLGADYGDCLWVEYGDAASPYRILIDGGTPGTFNRLKPYLESVRLAVPSHELLVITHIDEDHIGGGLRLLDDPDVAEQFKSVWFNGRRHLVSATEEEDFGAVQGEKLTAAILARGLPWNAHFNGKAVVRDEGGIPVVAMLEGGAKVPALGLAPRSHTLEPTRCSPAQLSVEALRQISRNLSQNRSRQVTSPVSRLARRPRFPSSPHRRVRVQAVAGAQGKGRPLSI